MDELKKQVEAALIFVGQAQEKAPTQSDLWKELGRIFDELDSTIEGINDGDFGQDGMLR
jgi:hypothetical protein